MSFWHIKTAARVVSAGGIIAYPTEAVYGLGCSPWDAGAVARILTLKRRDPARGLIVIASDFQQLEPLLDLSADVALDEILQTRPGPVTWILPAGQSVPRWLRGDHPGIAVRVTAHKTAARLCTEAGPLVSTSANPEGYPPARTPIRVRAYFRNRIDQIVPGATGSGRLPTEIRVAASGEILRHGG